MEPQFPRSLAVALALWALPAPAQAAAAETLENIEREIGIAEGAAVRLEARLAVDEPDRNTATLTKPSRELRKRRRSTRFTFNG